MPPASSDVPSAANEEQIHHPPECWDKRLQVPAYIRRPQWRAKEAFARRQKMLLDTQPTCATLKNKITPLKIYGYNNTQSHNGHQERLILSGSMADVCVMLEQLSHASY